MEKWEPIFWIIGSAIGLFLLILLVDILKGPTKKKPEAQKDKPTHG